LFTKQTKQETKFQDYSFPFSFPDRAAALPGCWTAGVASWWSCKGNEGSTPEETWPLGEVYPGTADGGCRTEG